MHLHISPDQGDRGHIPLPAHRKIINQRTDHNPPVDDHVPIHAGRRDGYTLGEETENPDPAEEQEGKDIDGQTEDTERPATGRQGRPTDTSEDYTTDGDDVGGK